MRKYLMSLVFLISTLQLFSQVGIGTTNPTEKLHIEGGTIKIVNGSQSKQKVLTTDDNGVATWEYANGDGGEGTSTFIVGHFTSANNATDIFHLKTPFKPAIGGVNGMYRIQVKGYAYGAPAGDRIINITYVGYSYTPSALFLYKDIFITGSTNITAGDYVGSDGFIYLWFKTPSVYFNSFGVTSMYVGNGRVLKKGEITVIQSALTTL